MNWAFSPEPFFADNVIDAMSSVFTLQVIWGLWVMLLQGLDFGWKL